jgi:hypothetical protein
MTFQEQIQQQGLRFYQKTLRNRYQSRTKTQRNPFVRRKKTGTTQCLTVFEPQHHAELIKISEELKPTDAFTCTVCVLIMKCVRVQLMNIRKI